MAAGPARRRVIWPPSASRRGSRRPGCAPAATTGRSCNPSRWRRAAGWARVPRSTSTAARSARVANGRRTAAHETIVLGAHWDHLGSAGGDVFHGADDNASGTAVVVGLARAFAAAGGASRTLVFVLFGAEETGLIGSGHYVRHPAVPLSQTVAMLNFDMVGRMRDGKVIIGGVDSGDR